MLELISKLADLLLRASEHLKTHAESKRRRQLVLDLLTTYFVLRSISETGERLISLAGDDPVSYVTSLADQQAARWFIECKYLMFAQRANLHRLSSLLGYEGLPVLDLFDADLRGELKKTIGSKGSGLFSIGAALEISIFLGELPSQEDVARFGEKVARLRSGAQLIRLLISDESEPAPIKDAKAALRGLQAASERLRAIISELCETDELLQLSSEAERRANDPEGIEIDSSAGAMIYDTETCPFSSE